MDDTKGTLLRSRRALAAIVAIACLSGCIALALVPDGSRGADPAPAAAAPGSLPSHGQSLPGVSERELRERETAALGPEHALEHAAIRRAMRTEQPPADVTPSAESIEKARQAATVEAAELGDASDIGRWDFDATKTFDIVAIHAALLPTGKVMFFSYPLVPEWKNSAEAYLWDPTTGEVTRNDPPLWRDPKDGVEKPANIWCSGHTFTADGELVVFGGNLDFSSGPASWKGLEKVYTFNPFTETWKEQPDMQHGRWYPTGVLMADGRIPITSGLDETGTGLMNEQIETFTPASTLGGVGTMSQSIGTTSDTDPLKPPTGGYYPHMFAMPSGRAFVVGPQQHQTWFMNDWTGTLDWDSAASMSKRRVWGTAVPLPGDTGGSTKIMALGGSTFEETLPSNSTTEVYDEARPGLGWQSAPDLKVGRGHANTVLLPDGSMVEVGGGVGRDDTFASPLHAAGDEHKQVELWDPQTGEWRLGPSQLESRAYHSTALLLPDGRVMSAGDEWHGAGGETGSAAGGSDTAEIYEPPYLHKGPRPTITSAPETIKVGADFGVQTPNANVTKAVLVAPGSVTHAVDMNQRLIPLALTKRSGCVDLAAPPNANAAPPGYYMLFLLNDQGVPSIAKFVKLRPGGDAPAKCVVTPPVDPPVDPPDPLDPPVKPKPPVKKPPVVKPPVVVPPKPPVNRAPIVSRLKLSSNRISFRLSEPGTVTIAFERKGRRSRYTRLGTTLTRRCRTGASAIAFNPLKRGFRAGDYRLVVRARDLTGKRSATVKARFRVTAPARQPRRRP